jgi:hypothetical protein
VPVGCEFTLVALQLYHGYRHSHRVLDMTWATPLLRTLYADGFIYFVVVVALRLWNAFIVGYRYSFNLVDHISSFISSVQFRLSVLLVHGSLL